MQKYILAAVIATVPMLASTSANAITVQPGSQLSITVQGTYATDDGNNIAPGSALNITFAQVGFNSTSGGGVDLDGLTNFSTLVYSGPVILADSANSGLQLGFATTSGATFTVSSSFDTNVTPPGPGGSGLSAVGGFDSKTPGSFTFGTTSKLPQNTFQITLDAPPTIEDPEPEPDVIPLPAAAWMLLAALGALVGFRRFGKA